MEGMPELIPVWYCAVFAALILPFTALMFIRWVNNSEPGVRVTKACVCVAVWFAIAASLIYLAFRLVEQP